MHNECSIGSVVVVVSAVSVAVAEAAGQWWFEVVVGAAAAGLQLWSGVGSQQQQYCWLLQQVCSCGLE